MTMLRRLSITLMVLLGLLFAPQIASAQNPNTPVEGRDYFVSDTGDDDTTVLVRVAQGINLNTDAFATRFNVTPFDLRRENSHATLALCKNDSGRFQMSKGVVSVATREIETIWQDCPAERRYTYIVPGSTLLITIGKHHPTYEQEHQALVALNACEDIATEACIKPALGALGKTLAEHDPSQTPDAGVDLPADAASTSAGAVSCDGSGGSSGGTDSSAGSAQQGCDPFRVLVGLIVFGSLIILFAGLWLRGKDKVSLLRERLRSQALAAIDDGRELRQRLDDVVALAIRETDATAQAHAKVVSDMERAYNKALRDKGAELEKTREDHAAELHSLQVSLQLEQEEAVRAAVARSEELEKQITQLIVERSAEQDQLRELQESINEERENRRRIEDERSALRAQYVELTDQIDRLPDLIAEYASKLLDLDQQLDALGETDLILLGPLQDKRNGVAQRIRELEDLLSGARTQAPSVWEKLRQSYIDQIGISQLPPPMPVV